MIRIEKERLGQLPKTKAISAENTQDIGWTSY